MSLSDAGDNQESQVIEMDIMLMQQNEQFEMLKKILSPADEVDTDDSSSDTSTSGDSEEEQDRDLQEERIQDLSSSSEEDSFDTCEDNSPSPDISGEHQQPLTATAANCANSGLRHRIIRVQDNPVVEESSSETCSSEENHTN